MMSLLGKTIGQYQLIELVSQSNESLVFKGFQPARNRYAAVKMLLPSLIADRASVQQFLQEVRLIASLEHPNILPVYDYGQHEGLLYIATRYVEGGTLGDRLPQFHSQARARQMIHSIAEALDYVHSRGIIHGNLKPSNILIDRDGQPLLTDFGAFQNMGVGVQGNVYQSPEQARGGPVDRRTDVYALGVLLYEMLIGEPPPVGAVPSPLLKRPTLPTQVKEVILKAMAQYPEQRFQTADEFSQALNMALAPQAVPVIHPAPPAPSPRPAPAPPPPAPQPESEPRPETSWTVFLGGGLAVVCLLAAVLGFFLFTGLGGGESVDRATAVPTATKEPPPTPEPGQPPIAVINAPSEAEVGQTITLDARNSRAAGSIVSYAWQLGDGREANAVTIDHAYQAAGVYNVILTVTDDKGLQDVTNTQIQIREVVPTPEPEATPTPEPEDTPTPEPEDTPTLGQPPEPVINFPVEARVGEEVTFDGSESRPGSSPIASYEWDFDDGTTGSGAIVTHVYDDPGTYQVTLTVTGEDGLDNTGGPVEIVIKGE
jgi:chitodextrinase/tRNA A-37 threonylcarbamoyl transferase component Bud32